MDLSQTFKLEPPVSKIEQSRLSLCDFLGVHMLSHEIAKSRSKTVPNLVAGPLLPEDSWRSCPTEGTAAWQSVEHSCWGRARSIQCFCCVHFLSGYIFVDA